MDTKNRIILFGALALDAHFARAAPGDELWDARFSFTGTDSRIDAFAVAGTNAASRFGIFHGAASGPSLTATVTGSTLRISWPSAATGYQFESSPSLPDNWRPVTTGITDNGTTKTYLVIIDAGVTGWIYRLLKP